MARYCNSQCQKRDWKAHKLLHQDIEHAVDLKSVKITEEEVAAVEEEQLSEDLERAKIEEID